MRIVVVAPGAVGGYFGGLLAKAGENVGALARRHGTFNDRVGDLRAGADLHKVVVRNEGRLILKFQHADLRAGYYAGVTAYIDTTKRRIGPEYGIGGGIGGGSDWQMFRVRRWQAVGNGPSCVQQSGVRIW